MSRSAPTYDRQQLRRIEALHASGKVERAIDELRLLSKSALSSRSLRAKLVDWLQRAGRTQEAVKELFSLQELLTAQRDTLAAISAGLKIVELDPTFDNPLSYVAKVNADRMLAEQKQRQTNEGHESGQGETGERDSVESIPLLSDLSPEELSRVALSLKRRLLYEGAVLFERGDATQSLCFVVSGSLDIVVDEQVLDSATSGQCLGEFAFLTGEPRSATIVARTECEVLELSAGSMQAVAKEHPRIEQVLERMYQGRVLARVLAQSPLFGFMNAGERHRVAAKFEQLSLPAGEVVFRQGDQDLALYLVKRGRVEVRNQGFGTSDTDTQTAIRLGEFGPNEFFGEVSFLTGVARTATVVATEPIELLRIDREELNDLIAEYPQLKETLKKFHVERVMEAMQSAKLSTA